MNHGSSGLRLSDAIEGFPQFTLAEGLSPRACRGYFAHPPASSQGCWIIMLRSGAAAHLTTAESNADVLCSQHRWVFDSTRSLVQTISGNLIHHSAILSTG